MTDPANPLVPAQAPFPQTNPLNLPQPSIEQVNASMQQLVGSSFRNYAGLPDPRAAVEAIQTGSVTDTAAAMNDPSFASILSATPAGQSPLKQQATVGDLPAVPADDPFTWDKAAQDAYKQRTTDFNGHDSQWKSFGSVPVANVGWMNSVRQGDAGSVRKWQQYLIDNGFAPADKDGHPQVAASGVWDANTDASFRGFMISRFMPDAVYSKDESQRNRTKAFLTALGEDPNELLKLEHGDPEFRNQVVIRWLHAHGPDQGMRDGLNEFTDLYGDDAMPKALQDLKGGFWSKLGDSFGHLPILGNILSMPIDFAETGHLGIDALYKNTSSLKADVTESQLSEAERSALGPALQAAHDSSGYLGFLDSWDRLRTKYVLSVGYFYGDLFSGHGNKSESGDPISNMFDSGSQAMRGADAHQDNLMAGVFGDQFAHEHPLLATIGNAAANIADDPTTYLGGVGLLFRVEKGAEGMSAVTKFRGISFGQSAYRVGMLTPTAVKDAMREGRLGTHLLTTTLAPKLASQREMGRLLGKLDATNPLHVVHATNLLGVEGEFADHAEPIKAILSAKDDGIRQSLLIEHYGEMLHSPDYAFNMAEARKSFDVDNFAKLSEGKMGKMLLSGQGFRLDRSTQEHLGNPLGLARSLMDKAHTLRIAEEELKPILGKALSDDANTRFQAVAEFRAAEQRAAEALLKSRGLKLSEFEDWKSTGRKGRGMTADDEKRLAYVPMKDREGNIIEGSRLRVDFKFDTGDKAVDDMLLEHAHGVQAAIDHLKREHLRQKDLLVHDHLMRNDIADTPEAKRAAEQAVHSDQEFLHLNAKLGDDMAPLRDELDTLRKESKTKPVEGGTPVAAVSTQFQQWARTRYTPFEILAYTSPVLRRSEALQAKLHADQAMGVWKRMVLFKLSSSLRITLGDETGRFAIKALTDGGPMAFANYMHYAVGLARKEGKRLKMPDELKWDMHQVLSGFHDHDFIPREPGELGYQKDLRHMVENIFGDSDEGKVWTSAMQGGPRKGAKAGSPAAKASGEEKAISALEAWLKSDNANAAEHLRRSHLTVADNPAEIRRLAEGMHTQFKHVTKWQPGEDSFLFNMMVKSQEKKPVDDKAFTKFLKENSLVPDALPIVVARRAMGSEGSLIGREFNNVSQWFQHHVTDAMVNKQREKGWNFMREASRKQVKAAHPDWTEAQIEARAQMHASRWVKRNTYQGQRSITATAVRNIFPFYGATANFNRFVLRTFASHPWTIKPTLEMLNRITEMQQQGGMSIPIPGTSRLLARLGVANGDDLTWNPAHAFFLTSEGYGGSMPGLGPVFMVPLKEYAVHHPDFAAAMKKVPGFEYIDTSSPMFPWAERIASGVSMMATGKPFLEGVPLVGREGGYYEKRKLQIEREGYAKYLEGQGPAPTMEGAQQQEGRESVLTGVFGGLLPVSASTKDPRETGLQPALQAWDAAVSSDDKDKVIAAFPEQAPLLQYFDRRSTLEDKRRIIAQHPWVEAYSAGMTASGAEGVAGGTEPTTAAYKQDIADGRLRYLGGDEYLDKLNRNHQLNEAWTLYEITQTQWQQHLVSTGQAPTSAEAKTWKKLNIDPVIAQIGDTHTDWRNQFVKLTSRDAMGMKVRTMPLASLATWEVIPQHNSLETPTTQAWRQLLVWRDEAAGSLRQMKANARPKAEQQQLLDAFAQRVQYLAQSDPGFAVQIQNFKYSTVNDLISLEAESVGGSF